MSWAALLAEYELQKAEGELYPKCPRCDGSRYESAVPYSEIDSIRPTVEEYPCPLCVLVGTIDIDDAIKYIEGKVEMEE